MTKTLERARRRAAALKDRPAVEKLERLDLGYLATHDPPPIPWVVENLAAKSESTLFYGSGGISKSMFMQALQDGVVRGEDVAGFRCKPGRTMHFDSENGPLEIHRRVHKLTLSPLMTVINVVGIDLDDEDDLELVENEIIADEPDLVVFDSLRRLTPGSEENDSGTMSRVLSNIHWLCQRQDFAAIVIHHADKVGRTFRGSSAIRDQVSMAFKVGRVEKDDDKWRRFIETDKFRLGDEPDTHWFRIADIHDEGLAGVGRVRIQQCEAGDALFPVRTESVRETAQEDIAGLFGPPSTPLQRLRAKRNGGEPVAKSLSLSEIADRLGMSPTNGTLRRALAELVKDGELWRDSVDKLYWRESQNGHQSL